METARGPSPLKTNIAVVGLGNLLLADEGVGVHLLHELKKRYCFPVGVELIDGGTMGLDLLPFLEGRDRILFVDALNLKKKPGAIGELNNGEIPEFFSTKLSVHQIALPDMLAAGRFLGTLTEEMTLIGMQPESTDTGYGLSPAVREKFGALLLRVLAKLSEWGVHGRERLGRDGERHDFSRDPGGREIFRRLDSHRPYRVV